MSPEQVEGKDADSRSDLFAFGAVVHEMATGKKCFGGHSAASVIAAILEREPPAMSTLQPLTPRALDHVVSRCLAKDPDERWQTAADVMRELKWISDGATHAVPAAAVRPGTRERLAWAAGLAVVSALAVVLGLRAFRANPGAPKCVSISRRRLRPTQCPSRCLPTARSSSSRHYPTVNLYYGCDRSTRRPPPRCPAPSAGRTPFWSPDGRSLGFFADGTFKRLDVLTGSITRPAERRHINRWLVEQRWRDSVRHRRHPINLARSRDRRRPEASHPGRSRESPQAALPAGRPPFRLPRRRQSRRAWRLCRDTRWLRGAAPARRRVTCGVCRWLPLLRSSKHARGAAVRSGTNGIHRRARSSRRTDRDHGWLRGIVGIRRWLHCVSRGRCHGRRRRPRTTTAHLDRSVRQAAGHPGRCSGCCRSRAVTRRPARRGVPRHQRAERRYLAARSQSEMDGLASPRTRRSMPSRSGRRMGGRLCFSRHKKVPAICIECRSWEAARRN